MHGYAAVPDSGEAPDRRLHRNLEIARDFTYSALWMAYGAMLMVIGFSGAALSFAGRR